MKGSGSMSLSSSPSLERVTRSCEIASVRSSCSSFTSGGAVTGIENERVALELHRQSSERSPSMAERKLLFERDLAHGPSFDALRKHRDEVGVVAKSLVAPALEGDPALTGSFGHELLAVGRNEHGDTPVAGGALARVDVVERGDQLCVVVRVTGIIARVAGREDSGRAVERVHFEAGVVGYCRFAGRFRDRSRLRQRVSLKGHERFSELKARRYVVDGYQFHAGEQTLDLLQLVSVAGGEDRFQSASGAPSVVSCSPVSSPIPLVARSSNWSSSPRSKVPCSAVPCTSTSLPAPVITTFISTPAFTSSM